MIFMLGVKHFRVKYDFITPCCVPPLASLDAHSQHSHSRHDTHTPAQPEEEDEVPIEPLINAKHNKD